MHKSTLFRIAVLSLLSPAVFISTADAYQTYATSGTSPDRTGACARCHGGFEKDGYVSLKADHTPWDAGEYYNTRAVPPVWEPIISLHDVHRRKMGIGCNTCHTDTDPSTVSTRTPVNLGSSDGYLVGSTQEYTISCGGCHDAAGLRQHHFNTGITSCAACHPDDSDPAVFKTAGEDVLPNYYALVDPGRPQPPRPKDPCNADFSENFAGSSLGLDNDGNLLYDLKDPACASKVPAISLTPAALMFGTVAAGSTATLDTVIENKGVGTLLINVINRCEATSTEPATSTEFTWSPELLLPTDRITVAPNSSANLAVTYAPVDAGTDMGCLDITTNDPDKSTLKLGLNKTYGGNIFLYMPAIIQPAEK